MRHITQQVFSITINDLTKQYKKLTKDSSDICNIEKTLLLIAAKMDDFNEQFLLYLPDFIQFAFFES